MNDLAEIKKLWLEFYNTPLPVNLADIDEEFDAVAFDEALDLVNLDTFTAGCIDTFINNKGSLDNRRKIVLENCRKELEIKIDFLEGETKNYFEKLLKLADKVLQMF